MDEAFTTSSKSDGTINVLRGVVGAALGGLAGYFLFGWLLRRGYYAQMLPGALLGLGCGVFVQRRNVPLAIVCGVLALVLGLFTRWKHFTSSASNDFGLFLMQINRLPTIALLMVALGGVCGFWFALGTRGGQKAVAKE